MSLLLSLKDVRLSFPHKLCFETFSAPIYTGARIAVIGANGAGKSLLLKAISGLSDLHEGEVEQRARVGYVPQTVEDYATLSGGQRFNKALSTALSLDPSVLILDEPTNHLDHSNRNSLMRMIKAFSGAVITASHDVELIDTCFDTIWHIFNGKIVVIKGSYSEYRLALAKERDEINHEISQIKLDKKARHEDLMREQKRAKNSRLSGEKKRDNRRILPAAFNQMQSDGGATTGRKRKELGQAKDALNTRLNDLYRPETPAPTFSLPHVSCGTGSVLQVVNGSAGYGADVIIKDINITVGAHTRLAVQGSNGSGKTTFLKAVMGDPSVIRGGDWLLPPVNTIGFLDQHYASLNPRLTVFDTVRNATDMTDAELRDHLNGFLFKKNEEVFAKVSTLSGGEKARLSLAVTALNTPSLLILDEITNNIDLPAKEHITAILQKYPGAIIAVSHDRHFLKEAGITDRLDLE